MVLVNRLTTMMKKLVYSLLILLCISSCTPSGPKLEPLDLLSEGISIKIQAPPGVVAQSNDLGLMKDVTVKNESGYSIQIFETDATKLDIKSIVEDLKKEVESSEYFSKFISEDESGFVFEKKIDENYINYDFRHVKVRGDKQILIQTGLSSKNTLDQVKLMVKSVQ